MSFDPSQGGGAGKGFESTVAAPGVIRDEASCIVQESSGESGSTLKAHDYIGLSEVSSMPLKSEPGGKSLPDLNLGETELRLGPPKSSSAPGSAIEAKIPPAPEAPSSKPQQQQQKPESGKPEQEIFWQAQISARMIQEAQNPGNEIPNGTFSNSIKNSNNKRAFSEAIGGNGFAEGRSVMPTPPAGGNPATPGSSCINNNDLKVPVMPSSIYPWSTSKQLPAAWRMGLDQSKGSFGPFPSSRMQKLGDSPAPENLNSSPNTSGLTNNSKEDVNEENIAPSTSPPVVGWPPVQSFRKNTLASHPPPPQPKSSSVAPVEANAKSSPANAPAPAPPAPQAPSTPLFVKVYMDGVPIGRKVDLKTNNSYDKLSSVLEDMFHRFITGQEASSSRDTPMSSEKKLNFLHSSDFVLTYEDKDGDLMLVGDVPWGMFTGTVKRLRIMKGSEAIGLAPRAPAGDKAPC